MLGFALAIAAVPAGYRPGFATLAVIATMAAVASGVRLVSVARRLSVAAPFLIMAALLPVVADGSGPTVIGVQLSSAGIEAGWTLAARVILGVGAASILASTTSIPELAEAARRLRVAPALVTIAVMMLRYVHVVSEEFDRARRSMASRGLVPRWFWQYRPVAASAGTLFVRSYERGERVHGAMVSRGFDGTLPPAWPEQRSGTARRVALAHWLPVVLIIGCSWSAAALGHLQ